MNGGEVPSVDFFQHSRNVSTFGAGFSNGPKGGWTVEARRDCAQGGP